MMKTELVKEAHISTNAMAKMGRNENVRLDVLARICTVLDCKIDDIVDFYPEDNVEQEQPLDQFVPHAR
jgi:DNA (cytosine-5)-methyltransferase 1